MDNAERQSLAELYQGAMCGQVAYHKLAMAFRKLWPEVVILTNDRDILQAELTRALDELAQARRVMAIYERLDLPTLEKLAHWAYEENDERMEHVLHGTIDALRQAAEEME